MKLNKLSKFLISIIICELAGIIGSIFTTSQINGWYKNLNKPAFNPPSRIFGPVWTILFVLMGIALYLVWSKKLVVKNKINKANIILIFATQLILNILWSVIFFGMHQPGVAFFELLMLWFAIIFTMVNFYRVSKTASWLLLPYILWVSFAAILNLSIFILN